MRLPVVDNALAAATKFFADKQVQSAPGVDYAKHLVTQGLVVLTVSEFEQHIEQTFKKRAQLCGDIAVANFVEKMLHETLRSPDLSKILSVLGKFEDSRRVTMKSKVENNAVHVAWDNIMKARHAAVHKKSVFQMTLEEFVTTMPTAEKVLDALDECLK